MENRVEIWKPVVGYEGLYEVSSFGRVRSLNYNHTGKEKILKYGKRPNGYLKTTLMKNGIRKDIYIHRLVAETFVSNTENKPYVDHIDTNILNNKAENLRWCTQKENVNNPLSIEKKQGKNNYNAKPILQFTLNGEFIRRWDCIIDASNELGCSYGNISSCCNGRRNYCSGFIWKYYDLETYLIGVMNNNIKRTA